MNCVATAPIRVFLADDHQSVLWGLEKLIESASPAMELAGKASSRAGVLELIGEARPDVMLLDFDLGEQQDGSSLITELRQRHNQKVIVLTGMRDEDVPQQVVLAGAYGFVHKSEPAKVILDAIRHVHGGQLWLKSGAMSRALAVLGMQQRSGKSPDTSGIASLTVTEKRIVSTVLEHKGAPNKVIASALHISVHTLRNHLASIYSKLDLHHRLDLVLYVQQRKQSGAEL